MDPSELIPKSIVSDFSALVIQGTASPSKNITTPLYRQPGYSTKNLELFQLICKPIALDSITIDATFESYRFFITALTPTIFEWVDQFMKHFVCFRFNIQLNLVIPGHQFAIMLLGGAYDPSAYSDINGPRLWTLGGIGNIGVPTGVTAPQIKYNYITTLNGNFVETSESPVTLSLKSDIPINYPMNPIESTLPSEFNVFLGAFMILPIVPPRFPGTLTSITARPFINLCDIEYTPWVK